jgi:hypothetical protein
MDADELMEEREQQAFVEWLLECDMLEGAAAGVAKLYVDQGSRALSEKQQFVLDRHVLGAHLIPACDMCSGDIPMSEQIAALDDKLCSWCRHKLEKDD